MRQYKVLVHEEGTSFNHKLSVIATSKSEAYAKAGDIVRKLASSQSHLSYRLYEKDYIITNNVKPGGR